MKLDAMIFHSNIEDALNACQNKHEIITCTNLDRDENIHCLCGAFYYEDGVLIGGSAHSTFHFLNKQVWAHDGYWLSSHRLNEETMRKLKQLHDTYDHTNPEAFKKEYFEIINE